METRRRLTVSGILILTLAVTLALAAGLTLAQGNAPETNINEPSGPEDIAEPVFGAIPIQGRLTDNDGNALDGYHVITMSLYATSWDTTPLCQDDDLVNVEDGLFATEMDWCSSSDIDGKQLYLGIQIEGDAEMSPRQIIYPVPYAYSLRPGAIISGSTSVAIVHIENWYSSGRGLRVYAMSETGTNYTV